MGGAVLLHIYARQGSNNNYFGYYLSLLYNKYQRRPRELVLSKKKKVADGTQAVENAEREM